MLAISLIAARGGSAVAARKSKAAEVVGGLNFDGCGPDVGFLTALSGRVRGCSASVAEGPLWPAVSTLASLGVMIVDRCAV